MQWLSRTLALASLLGFSPTFASAATVTGTVKGPDGAPFEGGFVEAQNTQNKITFIALSDAQGRFLLEKIPAGDYRLHIKAVGYRADERTGVNLSSNQNTSYDFTLQKDTVRWSDLSIDQARALLPPGAGKDLLFHDCFACHGFQTRMAAVRRDLDGWKDRVQYMRDAMHFSLDFVTDQDASQLAGYLDNAFGAEATLPKSPADLPG